MAKLNIEQAHSLPVEEVKKRLQTLAERLSEKYGIHAKWTSDREAEVKRTGVTGTITCNEQMVRVFLDLSFMLNPLKEKIETRVRTELKNALA